MATARDTTSSRLTWALAAFLLFLVVIAAAAPRLTEEADQTAGRLRLFEGLAAARAVAGVAEATKGDDAVRVREAAAALMASDPSLQRVFFIGEGGTDEYGIAAGREFVYDSLTGGGVIGDSDKDLLDQATRVGATAAARGITAVPVREIVQPRTLPDGRRQFLVFAPAMGEQPDSLLGVAGVVRVTTSVPIRSHFLLGIGLALLAALLFAALHRLFEVPRRAFGIAAFAVLTTGVAGGALEIRDTQNRVAAEQVAALTRAEAAFQSVVTEGVYDPDLAWALTLKADAPRPISGGAGTPYEPVPHVLSARVFQHSVMPAALLLIGLVVVFFALPGTAGLLAGIRQQPTTYTYILPVFVAMGAVIFYPFLKGVEFAFLDANAQAFVGLANFQEILIPKAAGQTNFWRTLAVTILWTATNVTLHVTIGLGLALLLNNKRLACKGLYRVLLIVPWAMPNYITALTWKTMFNTQYGAVNILLQSLGIDGPNWFGPSFITNFSANLITNVWLGFPFMMVVSLGALQSIPLDLYEAADIDGANRFQKFRRVTLPLLKPALFPAIILGTIWTFNQFNVIYLVSGGGPDHKTEILITEAYYLFKVLGQYGMAAAYCLMIFLILLVYTVMTNRITKATQGAFDG